MKFLTLFLVLLLSVACGKKSSSKRKINRIFVKGDPLTLIKDTQKNQVSFITKENLEEFNNYSMGNFYFFAEKEQMPERKEDIESGNEAEDEDRTEEKRDIFNLVQTGSDTYKFENPNGSIALNFKLEGNNLNLISLNYGEIEYKTIVEHYSVTEDKKRFSILVRVADKAYGNLLMNLVFQKEGEQKEIRKISSDYKYIYGPGVVVPWKLDEERKITVDVCPNISENFSLTKVKKALKVWESPFRYKEKKLIINVRTPSTCKPFSDVNEHAIHYIDSYLTVADKDRYNPGFAMLQADLRDGHIYDADIVLLGSEISKDTSFADRNLARVITHEFGHFLGLHHQFDDDSTSIMSYESIYYLGLYDEEAITNLYENE